MLEQVWCYTTTKELDKERHSYENLFKHHNTTPSCLSLHTFHRVFLASTLQLLAANRSDFALLGLTVLLACDDVITLFLIQNTLVWVVSSCINA